MIEAGDIIANAQGAKGYVNWAKDGKVGVSFLPSEKDYWPGAMVYREEEVELVRKGAPLMRELFPTSAPFSVEELRVEREQRKVLPTEPERKKREEDRWEQLISELSPEELEELMKRQ